MPDPRFKAELRIQEPDDIRCTMTITMSLEDWQRLDGQLAKAGTSYPGWTLQKAIRQLVARATARFEAEEEVTS